ncbi:nucleolar and spindle-associated protein 1 [Dunckerocampus dactyliophorus]|uniref:nucleolar and spindle-associated protein 1 n=1 Tax=Dunckerocampus dactyliophorus TaxID=161453 RepID=UPI00240687A1|nr:nucleolar and spindle-associated protein 1 [Dunckerocampus dactyliophorus]
MDLDSMKYAELRGLAKQLGLKANMKADKLLKAVKQHFERQNTDEEKGEELEAEVCNAPPVFVNTRRGRAKTKRTSDDVEAVTPHQGVSEVASASPPQHVHKRRRVSSPTKTEAAESERVVVLTDTDGQLQQDTNHQGGQQPCGATRDAGKIPRLKGDPTKRRPLKPVTPNFKKLHQAHFNKMESIDAYMQRKRRNMETVQELKALKQSRSSMFSPAPDNTAAKATTAEEKGRAILLLAGKEPHRKAEGRKDAVFKPSVLSTRRMNVRFSEATPDNEYKMSLVKTPARMSFSVTSSTPRQTVVGRKSTLSATKTPATFVFTGNTSSVTPVTQKKPTFDLKASLSRPLPYKPHTGKLKPFGDGKDDKTANALHQRKYKQRQVQTREDRQAKHAEDRKQKKSNMLCARRGLVMM